MPTQRITLARLLEERRRQDDALRSLCEALATLDPEQRLPLSEELESAWEFSAVSPSCASAWYALRA